MKKITSSETEAPIQSNSDISRDKNKVPDQNALFLAGGNVNRKRSPVQVLKAALLVLRLKSSKSKSKPKPKPVKAPNSVSKWKRVVGSMRPMHLQINESPKKPDEDADSIPEGKKEANTVPFSPNADHVSTLSPDFSISSYGSTSDLSQYDTPNLSLQEINDNNIKATKVRSGDEVIAEEKWCDEEGGDEMIDSKAEEFIAHFYEQMRLQNSK